MEARESVRRISYALSKDESSFQYYGRLTSRLYWASLVCEESMRCSGKGSLRMRTQPDCTLWPEQ